MQGRFAAEVAGVEDLEEVEFAAAGCPAVGWREGNVSVCFFFFGGGGGRGELGLEEACDRFCSNGIGYFV